MPKNVICLSDVEHAVLTMVAVAAQNEKYFGDLDGEMGDADFGKSLAQGFQAIQAEFDTIDHSDIGVLLLKCGMIFAANVGGCSGPLWGTAFMRAGMTAKGKTTLTLADMAAMGRNAVEGMRAVGEPQRATKLYSTPLSPPSTKLKSSRNPIPTTCWALSVQHRTPRRRPLKEREAGLPSVAERPTQVKGQSARSIPAL